MSESTVSMSMLPAKIERSIAPPPKKVEVIEALAQIKLQKFIDENNANVAKAEALEKECKTEIKSLASQRINEPWLPSKRWIRRRICQPPTRTGRHPCVTP